ncbi:MAG: 30S ribosome-binding factor RbfA [Acidobacteriota bacterium]|nr:30S ribosome-binding factor RbfA [Acidobacteriota bacterium]
MPQGSRASRVGDQIRAELAELLAREVHDPGIGFLTITRVKVSPDLQQARVFYTTLGDDAARKDSARALQRATPFLKRHVGRRLQLKRVPELTWMFDESIEKTDRIERILQGLHSESAEASVPASSKENGDVDDPGPHEQ